MKQSLRFQNTMTTGITINWDDADTIRENPSSK